VTDLAITKAFKQIESELSICTECHHAQDVSELCKVNQCVNPECHCYLEADRETYSNEGEY